jgi:hypothetical protein
LTKRHSFDSPAQVSTPIPSGRIRKASFKATKRNKNLFVTNTKSKLGRAGRTFRRWQR